VVHLALVRLVVGKALYWDCCRKLSQVEDDTGAHAIAVNHRGRHDVTGVEDNRAPAVILRVTGKEAAHCSLDGCMVAAQAGHGRSHIPDPGGSHCRRDRVDTFLILFLYRCIPSVGFFLC